jgi:DNA polymerase-3 subunit epsilon
LAISDFIALDVETANSVFSSFCSIGLVHFRSGEVFKSLTILVDPEDDFSPANYLLNVLRLHRWQQWRDAKSSIL